MNGVTPQPALTATVTATAATSPNRREVIAVAYAAHDLRRPGRLPHLKAEGRRFDPPLTTTLTCADAHFMIIRVRVMVLVVSLQPQVMSARPLGRGCGRAPGAVRLGEAGGGEGVRAGMNPDGAVGAASPGWP